MTYKNMNNLQMINTVNKNEEDIVNLSSQLEDMGNDKKYINNSVYELNKRPIITLIIDDGDKQYNTMFKDVIESNNIKPCLSVVCDWVGTDNFFTLDELKEFNKKGYDILTHSKTHSDKIFKDNGTYEQVDSEFSYCNKFMIDNGFNSEVLVYPFGGFKNPKFYKNIARKYFNNAVNAVAQNTFNKDINDNMYLERFFINKSTTSLEQIKAKINYTNSEKGWLILGLHTNPTECDSDFLRSIIEHINALGISIMNVTDTLKEKSNAVNIGEFDEVNSFYVSKDGEIKNGYNIIPWGVSSEYQLDRSPSGYNFGMTQLNLPNKDNNTIPCTLLNFKSDNGDFSFQLKKNYNRSELYVREWDNIESKWNDFTLIGNDNLLNFDLIVNYGKYVDTVRTIVKKSNRILNCKISIENSLKQGDFPQGELLCSINKEIHSSFQSFKTTCVISRDSGVVEIGFINVSRTGGGKIGIYVHGEKKISDIRWIDCDFTIVE